MKSGSHNEIGVVGAGGCGQEKMCGSGRRYRPNPASECGALVEDWQEQGVALQPSKSHL